MNLWNQDKGQLNCVKEFLDSINNQTKNPIPENEIFEVARVSIEISEILMTK